MALLRKMTCNLRHLMSLRHSVVKNKVWVHKFLSILSLHPFLDWLMYCSAAQGLLDWFELDLGFTKLLFVQTDWCVVCFVYCIVVCFVLLYVCFVLLYVLYCCMYCIVCTLLAPFVHTFDSRTHTCRHTHTHTRMYSSVIEFVGSLLGVCGDTGQEATCFFWLYTRSTHHIFLPVYNKLQDYTITQNSQVFVREFVVHNFDSSTHHIYSRVYIKFYFCKLQNYMKFTGFWARTGRPQFRRQHRPQICW